MTGEVKRPTLGPSEYVAPAQPVRAMILQGRPAVEEGLDDVDEDPEVVPRPRTTRTPDVPSPRRDGGESELNPEDFLDAASCWEASYQEGRDNSNAWRQSHEESMARGEGGITEQ